MSEKIVLSNVSDGLCGTHRSHRWFVKIARSLHIVRPRAEQNASRQALRLKKTQRRWVQLRVCFKMGSFHRTPEMIADDERRVAEQTQRPQPSPFPQYSRRKIIDFSIFLGKNHVLFDEIS